MNLKYTVFIVFMLPTINAVANPVNWSIDAEFSAWNQPISTEVLTGYFTYDIDTLTVSNVNLIIKDISSDAERFHYRFGIPEKNYLSTPINDSLYSPKSVFSPNKSRING